MAKEDIRCATIRTLWALTFGVTAALGAITPVLAQTFPAKTVRLIVPYPPGGGTDIAGRIVAQKLNEAWGQPVVVENKSGAAGTIGATQVAQAAPDGYTVGLVVNAFAITAALYGSLPYDPVKSFVPVSLVASYPFVLVVNPGVPAQTAGELVALAKSQQGKLTYASAGVGSGGHMAMEILKAATGMDMLHVPYRGTAPALQDVMGGQTSAIFDPLSTVLPLVKSGKLRALAVSMPRRTNLMPDVPTVAEATGVKDFDLTSWFALLAPANTPPTIVEQINEAVAKALGSPDTRERFEKIGIEPWPSTSQDARNLIDKEIARFTKVIKALGISNPGSPK